MARTTPRQLLQLVGQRVMELRTERGLTQEQLAERLGWWPRQVQRVEAGEANISVSKLANLANAVDVEPIELLRATGKRPKRRPGRPRAPIPG